MKQSNWSVENIRAARHSKLMCALVLALRKIPIFGPGGGGPPLGDPTNPSYNVAVSDDVAVAAREKAARDADAAPLKPVNTENSRDTETSQLSAVTRDDTPEQDRAGPTSESMAANAMNAVRLGGSLESPAEEKGKELKTVSSRSGMPPEATNIQNSTSVKVLKTKSPQGRRRAGSSALLISLPLLGRIQSIWNQCLGMEKLRLRWIV